MIPHGVLEHLAGDAPRSLRRSWPPFATELPVVLCFGLMRPYKGIDLLLEAWRGIDGRRAVDRGDAAHGHLALRAAAPPGVRFVPRFIGDAELPAYFRRADLVVLPYREIDQSGVLFTALAFGKPLLLSDVGGFPEIAATGAARSSPPATRPRCTRRCASCSAIPAALRAGRRRRAARGRRVLLGRDRARARSRCTSRS